ncbi:hypothetical protein [Azospirillum sp. B510]|uniref:hypothetical protein n=1 Tax=Azospirillum sp. (strain B510) TaxID=137722 RepID=UPI0011D07274|nr:hypothetical protein [Azospirillum sp. B510]
MSPAFRWFGFCGEPLVDGSLGLEDRAHESGQHPVDGGFPFGCRGIHSGDSEAFGQGEGGGKLVFDVRASSSRVCSFLRRVGVQFLFMAAAKRHCPHTGGRGACLIADTTGEAAAQQQG